MEGYLLKFEVLISSRKQKNSTKMKKFLAIALIAATFTSCGDGDKTSETTTDTTTSTNQVMETAPVTTPTDTTSMTTTPTDTSNRMSTDTSRGHQ